METVQDAILKFNDFSESEQVYTLKDWQEMCKTRAKAAKLFDIPEWVNIVTQSVADPAVCDDATLVFYQATCHPTIQEVVRKSHPRVVQILSAHTNDCGYAMPTLVNIMSSTRDGMNLVATRDDIMDMFAMLQNAFQPHGIWPLHVALRCLSNVSITSPDKIMSSGSHPMEQFLRAMTIAMSREDVKSALVGATLLLNMVANEDARKIATQNVNTLQDFARKIVDLCKSSPTQNWVDVLGTLNDVLSKINGGGGGNREKKPRVDVPNSRGEIAEYFNEQADGLSYIAQTLLRNDIVDARMLKALWENYERDVGILCLKLGHKYKLKESLDLWFA